MDAFAPRLGSMDKNKRLYRSKKNKVFAGICGGVGEYFDIDPVVVRLIWLLIVVFTGIVPGLLVYIIAIYVVPLQIVTTPVTEETPIL